jgi:hypothetical protein
LWTEDLKSNGQRRKGQESFPVWENFSIFGYMINDISFRRFLHLRQSLFDVLQEWGPCSDNDGSAELRVIFEGYGAIDGASFNPYQKTQYEIIIVGDNHDGLCFRGENFEHLLDQFEESINKMWK